MGGIAPRASSTLSGFSFPSLARLRLLRGWLWCLLRPTYRCRSSPHRNSGVCPCFTTSCRPAASLLRWMTATTIPRKGRTCKAILIRAARNLTSWSARVSTPHYSVLTYTRHIPSFRFADVAYSIRLVAGRHYSRPGEGGLGSLVWQIPVE